MSCLPPARLAACVGASIDASLALHHAMLWSGAAAFSGPESPLMGKLLNVAGKATWLGIGLQHSTHSTHSSAHTTQQFI